jgi:hypothetical protein
LSRFHTRTDPLKRLKTDPATGEWLLPDLDLLDADRAWSVWTLLQVSEWRYPQDIDHDADLLHDVLEISAASRLVERMIEERDKPPETSKRQ